jgi:hypothetical protein
MVGSPRLELQTSTVCAKNSVRYRERLRPYRTPSLHRYISLTGKNHTQEMQLGALSISECISLHGQRIRLERNAADLDCVSLEGRSALELMKMLNTEAHLLLG